MDLSQLWDQTGRVVRLRFRDGEDVEARLLATDAPAHADITYEVIRVHRSGKRLNAGTTVGTVLVASTDDLAEWQAVN
jgi:hypothetical protein